MACGNALCAHTQSRGNELLKLDLGIAEAAGNRCLAGQVLLDKGIHHAFFEALLEIDNVVGNAQEVGHAPGVVYVVERAAASAGLARFGGALLQALQPGQPPLVPELHRQTHNVLGTIGARRIPLDAIRIVLGQNGGSCRAVHATTHGHGDCHKAPKIQPDGDRRRDF